MRVTSTRLHGKATIIGVKHNDVLIECDEKNDGKFVMDCVFGYIPRDRKARLRWMKKKELNITNG